MGWLILKLSKVWTKGKVLILSKNPKDGMKPLKRIKQIWLTI